MFTAFEQLLGLSPEENERAIEAGYKALEDYETGMRNKARDVLDQLEREDRIGIVMLGRPYHHDPGLNHEILDEFQKLGYPIFLRARSRSPKTSWTGSFETKFRPPSFIT